MKVTFGVFIVPSPNLFPKQMMQPSSAPLGRGAKPKISFQFLSAPHTPAENLKLRKENFVASPLFETPKRVSFNFITFDYSFSVSSRRDEVLPLHV